MSQPSSTSGSGHGARARVALRIGPEELISLEVPTVPRQGEVIETGGVWYHVKHVVWHAGQRADGVVATLECDSYFGSPLEP